MVRVFPDARGALTPTYWIEGQSRDLCPLGFDLHLIISRGGFLGVFSLFLFCAHCGSFCHFFAYSDLHGRFKGDRGGSSGSKGLARHVQILLGAHDELTSDFNVIASTAKKNKKV